MGNGRVSARAGGRVVEGTERPGMVREREDEQVRWRLRQNRVCARAKVMVVILSH